MDLIWIGKVEGDIGQMQAYGTSSPTCQIGQLGQSGLKGLCSYNTAQ